MQDTVDRHAQARPHWATTEFSLRLPLGLAAVGIAGFFFVLLSILLMISGTPVTDSLQASIFVSINTGAGFIAIVYLLRSRMLGLIAGLGLAIPTGIVFTILSTQLLRSTVSPAISWLLPAVLLFILSFVARYRRITLSVAGLRQNFALFAVIATGMIAMTPLWRVTPINPTGWTSYFPDLSFHEALTHSLSTYGPSQTIFLAGFPFRYYWFANAWSGALSNAGNLQPYEALTRVLYIVSMLAGIFLVWTWARKISTSHFAPVFAALVLVIAASPGSPLSYADSVLVTDLSPTHTFAIPFMLAISVLATDYFSGRRNLGLLVLVALLAFGLVGTRATHSLVLAASFAFVVVAALIMRKHRVQALLLGISAALGTLAGYLFAIAGQSASTATTTLAISPNTDVASLYGFPPYAGLPGAGLLAYIALAASMAALWSGVAWLLIRKREGRWFVGAWALGAAIAGLTGVVLFSQNGRSQISFLWGASIVLLPLSGIGFAESLEFLKQLSPLRKFGRYIVPGLTVIGIAIGALAVVSGEETKDLWFAGYLRWGWPTGSWVLAIALGLLLAIALKYLPKRFVIVSTFSIILVTAAMTTGLEGVVWGNAHNVPTATAGSSISVNKNYADAGQWIRNNIEPGDGLLSTNRFCDDPSLIPPECVSTSYIASVFSGHLTLIEGFSYAIQDMPSWAQTRVRQSFAFGLYPTSESRKYLWEQGVRWVWIDNRVQHSKTWDSYATPVYENADVTILKLIAPN